MGVRDLSLRDLTYLVAVADERHFGRAAEACFVSQPALSGQIQKIEKVLGRTVFERDRRRVLVTAVGEQLVRQARRVLREADRLGELAQIAQGVLTGPFRLGLIATLGPYLLPHLLRPLRRDYPSLELLLTEGLTAGLLEDLKGGRLDAIVLALPIEHRGLGVEPLFVEPFLLATPSSHPFATKDSVGVDDLRRADMVLLTEGHCLRDQALELCPSGREGRERLQTASLETLLHLIASDAGYSLVPSLAARKDPQLEGLLSYRPLDGEAPGRVIAMVWREGSPRSADLEALATVIRENRPEGLLEAEPPGST